AMAEQREFSSESGVCRFDDGVAFGGEAPVHHLDYLSPLFERGQETAAPRPHVAAQPVGGLFACPLAPDGMEFARKLRVAHLRRARAPQSVAQFGGPLARANPQLVEAQAAYLAELFKTDRHSSSLHDFDYSDCRVPPQPFGAFE